VLTKCKRVVVLVYHILLRSSLDSRRHKFRDACLTIVALIRSRETLATASWKVDNEGWHHEAANASTDLAFKVENCLEWSTEVLDTWYHITLVDVILLLLAIESLWVLWRAYRLDVIVGEFTD
jgi:hypothetical protein